MIDNAKQIVYPNLGALERTDEPSTPEPIKYAFIDTDDKLVVVYNDDSRESFDVKQGSIEPYTYGVVVFATVDGDYIIRPIDEYDGEWASKFAMELPTQSIKDLLLKSEAEVDMKYLENEDERLIAMKSPEDDNFYGVLYLNKSGAYVRVNETWVGIGPSDSAFEGAVPYDVIPATAQEFMDLYDGGDVTLENAEKYLEPVK